MNPNDAKDQMQPVRSGGAVPDGKPLQGGKFQENSPSQPDQPGAEFGGYGRADHAFGRDAGSASEGSQVGNTQTVANAETVPQTRRGGSDGASQTRHSSNNDSQAQNSDVKQPGTSGTGDASQRHGDVSGAQRTRSAPQQQGSDTPNQNHQDQGGLRNP